MKGLLLKDLYMIRHYCKAYLLIAAVFFAASFFAGDNMFFAFYPCLLCGMIPVNLLGYDEKSRFWQYSAALPYTKRQIVSSKYLLGLFTEAAVLIVSGVVQAVKMNINGSFSLSDFAVIMLSVLIMSAFISAIPLPFIFRYGVEKGRAAYYVMVGVFCAAVVLFANMLREGWINIIPSGCAFVLLAVIGVGVYIVSWCLSVRFFKKREC